MKMHRVALLAFTLTSVVALASANAGDMYVGPPAGPGGYKDAPWVPMWSGFYAGIQGGGAWGRSRFEDEVPPPSNWFNIDGFNAGGTIGYNMQFRPNWVAGVEADISGSGISGSHPVGQLGKPNGAGFNCGSGPCTTDVDWFGTVRGRLGYASSNLLVYGTGGLAYGGVKSEIRNAGPDFHISDTNVGWTAGGGIEYAFAPRWSVKGEYLHVDLGWTSRAVPPATLRSDTEFDLVRGGLNYHFGPSYEPLK
jgi:outer membrane immunogenic protein